MVSKKDQIKNYAEIQQEIIKCLTDTSRRYMIENYLSTYDGTQKKMVPFKLMPRQVLLTENLRDYDNNITVKSRQQGVTTTVAAVFACHMVLASKESPENILCIANKLDLSQLMIVKIKEFIYQLPRWFFGDDYFSFDPKSDKNDDKKTPIFATCNQSELKLANNSSMAHARSSGPNASRGISSVSQLVMDEVAFIDNGKQVYTTALPTVSTGGKITLISTPNGKDELYYEIYDNAKKGKNNFHITELLWYQDFRYNKNLRWEKFNEELGTLDTYYEPTLDKKGTIEYNEEKWKKYLAEGWKPRSPWYDKMCLSFNNNPIQIAQELDISFVGSANNVVAPEFIEFQENTNVRQPLFFDKILEDMWIWKPPMEGHEYIISVDPSRGDGADNTAIEIIDANGIDEESGIPILEQVAEYNGKRSGDEIGEIIYDYGTKYNNALAVVECIGGVGDPAVLELMKLNYPNLYYDDPTLNSYTVQRRYVNMNINNEERLPGFHSSSVRFQMLSNFASMVKNNEFKIRSTRVISELETWIFKGTALRMDHMAGKHDDTLTCLAMGLFVLLYTVQRMERSKKKDIAMVQSWVNTANLTPNTNSHRYSPNTDSSVSMAMPFYNRASLKKTLQNQNSVIDKKYSGNNLWLMGLKR